MSAGTTAATSKLVQELKVALAKVLPCDTPETTEQARDILARLDEVDMTLSILTETLVGTVISKLKVHAELSHEAKQLVKKWKKLAKQSGAMTVSSSSKQHASSVGQAKPTSDTATTIPKPVPAQRCESAISAASTEAAEMDEWSDLPAFRQTICNKLHSILELSKVDLQEWNAHAVSQLCVSRTSEIEGAIYQKLGINQDRPPYVNKARSLCFNLKKNASLRESVLMGRVSAEALVTMSSEELATSEKQQARAEQMKKLSDSRRLDWEQANEDKINKMCGIKGELLSASLFTCGRCKSIKTTSTQKQTRSADEPMTVFVLCMNCGKRWKC